MCALFEQCLLPLASGVDAAFVALLAAHVPLVHDAALALRLSRRPLRQAAAPLQRAGAARRAPSAARSATRSCLARAPRSATCSARDCGTTRSTFSPTASCLLTRAVVGGSAPTFADSLAVWYRVSPGETALPFHRKRPAYEAPTKKMLKYCANELDPKSRTLLDYNLVEVARQNGAGGAHRLLCSCDRAR